MIARERVYIVAPAVERIHKAVHENDSRSFALYAVMNAPPIRELASFTVLTIFEL
jgi:hypothetical protein